MSRLDLLPPQVTVTDHEAGTAPGLVFLGAKIEDGQNGAMILDDEGELVWFWPSRTRVTTHADVRVQEYLGNPVITMWEGRCQAGNRLRALRAAGPGVRGSCHGSRPATGIPGSTSTSAS